MYASDPSRVARTVHAVLLFLIAYVLSVWLLGALDALSVVLRLGSDHRLRVLELAWLAVYAAGLSARLQLVLVAVGTSFVGLWAAVPLRAPAIRTALLCLPLGLAASVTVLAAKNLPLVARLPVPALASALATGLALLAFVALGMALERATRSHGPRFRWLAATPLALMLAGFIAIFGLTEAVMARIPATFFSLLALTYLVAFVLAGARRRVWAALVVVVLVLPGVAYVVLTPRARSARVQAVIAHKTQLSQALLFGQLAVFGVRDAAPSCDAPAVAPLGPTVVSARRSVLVISLDALRADHLAAYGYDRTTMPNVEKLLRESVVFAAAYAAAPATAGSFSGMWTASSAYTLRSYGGRAPTLQARLRAKGYRVLGSDLSRTARDAAPGFPADALWHAPVPEFTPAAELSDALIASITASAEPFVAFAHFMESHDEAHYRALPRVFPQRALSHYDDALFAIDAQIGRLLDALRSAKRYEDTIIAFTSDHGEFFGEHGRMFHGSLLYEPVVRVPLSFKLSHVPARREQMLASGFDLSPTLYRAATGEGWPLHAFGRDLFAELEAGRRDRAIYIENVSGRLGVRRVVAVRKGRFKYTRLRGTEVEELFDLERDPGELDNLAGEDPAQLGRMREELRVMLERQACDLAALSAAR